MNVLVVDDDEMVRYVLTEKLCQYGFTATAACDGQSAVELFREAAFDAVLLDLKMPGMDGIETLKELRKYDPDIPVIMITAFGDIATAVEAIKLGAYDFVEKPPQISRIMVTLRRAIEKATLERRVRDLGKSVEESAALKQAYEKLKELDQVKSTFLSSVSHELRTPLTSIIGFAEISIKKLKKLIPEIVVDNLKIGKVIQQVEENLVVIVSESARFAGLIESILDLTAMEAGTVEWRWEPLSIKEVVENSTDALLPAFKEKGLELEVKIGDDPLLIKGDRYRISQVINHMLSNASAFTERGRVTCSAKRFNNYVVLSVSDTGIGIPPSQHEMIFEKFSQIGDALTDKPKGVGLGLPICKLIVEYHGGTIAVESEPGKGSVFTISLPVEEDVRI
ncbi:MAG: hybrid sensor histidine kinase/response regulator [Desulfuromonadaceae bacterium]|nr:hybrid sensor histidine kinase/response regulator [Desulfuromonadaceae bacterium]